MIPSTILCTTAIGAMQKSRGNAIGLNIRRATRTRTWKKRSTAIDYSGANDLEMNQFAQPSENQIHIYEDTL